LSVVYQSIDHRVAGSGGVEGEFVVAANPLLKWYVLGAILLLAGGLSTFLWLRQSTDTTEGIASGNGRIEAVEVDITTKYSGRLLAILAKEGDMVEAGQALANMDVQDLKAQLKQAEAEVRQTRQKHIFAAAVIEQRKSELALSGNDLSRSRRLYESKSVSLQKLQHDETAEQTAKASLEAARAQQADAEAAIEGAVAKTEEIKTHLEDNVLKSPISGRVLYRLAEPGEVLPAGGKALTLLDLSDVYMTIFLSTEQAGKINIGSDARILLDALPNVVIPAKVSFVAPRAQFTPKEVETQTEREKLMFRVKVNIDPALLKKHIEKVKTGLPGIAYLRMDSNVQWPERLSAGLAQ
jgi:HlyD family secretion protein